MRSRVGKLTPYGFVLPAMILLITFGVLPIIIAGIVSLTDLNIAGLVDNSLVEFKGLDNYRRLFADRDFWRALGNTAFFVVIGVPSIVGLSLGIALLLNRSQGRLHQLLRSMYFLPAITAIVAVALVWGYNYNSQFGLLNYGLSLLGLPPVPWLSHPIVAKISVAIVAIWRGIGLNTIIILAALQSVPREYLEAAALDGASRWQTTTKVVIPLLRFALFFVTVTTFIAWLQFFDEVFVLTKGGPFGATQSIALFIYDEGFKGSQFGYASAGSVVLFVIIVVVTAVQLKVRQADVEY